MDEKLIERLCAGSLRSQARGDALEWPADFARDGWAMSPELLSLHGTEAYAALSDEQRRRLSFHELVNFFSLNIHGERALIQGLAQRLYRGGSERVSAYLHHFLDEENRHMAYFGGFCTRYAGKIYPDRKLALPREELERDEEDLLFFAKVLIFEEIVDAYNRAMADDERLPPLVRRINALHHRDEARHLAFGRTMVQELAARRATAWSAADRERVRSYLGAYLDATWKEYHNPSVYADTGLDDVHALRQRAFAHDARRAHRAGIERASLATLGDLGLIASGEAP